MQYPRIREFSHSNAPPPPPPNTPPPPPAPPPPRVWQMLADVLKYFGFK